MNGAHTALAIYEQPAGALKSLMSTVASMNLHQGTQTSLDAKLNAALNSINAGDSTPAMNQLNAFINAVNAQSGKHLTTSQAQVLVEFASEITDAISA